LLVSVQTGSHGTYLAILSWSAALTDPFKTLANISAIALLYGIWTPWASYKNVRKKGKPAGRSMTGF